MIRMLRGTVATRDEKSVVIDVSGVGYAVACGTPTLSMLKEGEEMTLFTYLAVRDDALDLFGFLRRDELAFFELLLTVPGIGPKGALGITGLAPLATLTRAIASEDIGYLTKVSGIGKKTAEKIVLELKGKLSLLPHEAAAPSSGVDVDVLSALLSLGYNERDAREAVQGLPKELTGVEEKIKFALKQIRR